MTLFAESNTDCFFDFINRENLLSKFEGRIDENLSVNSGNPRRCYFGKIFYDASISDIIPSYTESSFSNILFINEMIETTKKRKGLEYERLFTCINYLEIKRFLILHPVVANSLLSCYSAIISQFGNVRPILEVIQDKENTLWETLFISIPHELDFQVALDRLNNILSTWFSSRPKDVRKKVTLSVFL